MFDFSSIVFAHRWVLYGIPILTVLFAVWFYFEYKNQYPTLKISSAEGLKDTLTIRGEMKRLLPILRWLAMCLLLIAIARPQTTNTDEKIATYGIDIVFAFDISSSMLAQDFSPNRLEVAKSVANNFIEGRPADRFGLIVFSGESYPQVPITTDHNVVKSQISQVKNGILNDGTAIGMGIGSAVNRLIASDADSKVVILMTDGVNNSGKVDPITATEAAMQYDVKIYTIGIGSKGTAYMPAYRTQDGKMQYDYLPVEIDEELLKEVSSMTDAKYFRAEDEKALTSIYEEIDLLEKTEIESTQTINIAEKFHVFVFISMLFLGLEFLLRHSILRSFP